jgi:hypothetical protein
MNHPIVKKKKFRFPPLVGINTRMLLTVVVPKFSSAKHQKTNSGPPTFSPLINVLLLCDCYITLRNVLRFIFLSFGNFLFRFDLIKIQATFWCT